MSTLIRIIPSWAAMIGAVVLAVADILKPGVFSDPTVIVPLAAAYVLRCEIRPAIARKRAPSRRWLIIPIGLFVVYMLLPIDLLLVAVIVSAVIWAVRDDISIYRHHSHQRTIA